MFLTKKHLVYNQEMKAADMWFTQVIPQCGTLILPHNGIYDTYNPHPPH